MSILSDAVARVAREAASETEELNASFHSTRSAPPAGPRSAALWLGPAHAGVKAAVRGLPVRVLLCPSVVVPSVNIPSVTFIRVARGPSAFISLAVQYSLHEYRFLY